LYADVVDVVGAAVARGFVVGRGQKGQDAAVDVDAEQAGVGPADDAVGQGSAGVRVAGGDGGHGRAVFGHVDRGAGAAAVRAYSRRVVVGVVYRDRDCLAVGINAIACTLTS